MTLDAANAKSTFLREMIGRGHVYQLTDEKGLDEYAATGAPCGYIGFDATAKSLHVGSLVQIMNLRRLQQAGGKPVVLMGGGTTKIGDPTDKEKSRPILTTEEIAANMGGIRKNFEPFLKFGNGPTDAIMVDNAEWLDQIKWIEFLRDYGKHFTINKMIAQETVRRRLDNEEPYTFLEFNYMLLQAYDFLELARRLDCRIQMGGSDQWGNIVNGIDLGRRMGTHQLYALTCPLLTTSSGAKMGKTAQGAVWLNEAQLSAYDYWQYWRNTEDADVGRFLKLFTLLPLPEVARLAALGGAEINEAKKILATEATALIHGRDKAVAAAETARQAFEQGAAAEGLPVITADLATGVGVLKLAVDAGLASSNGEARKAVANGGLSLNGAKVTDPNYTVTVGDLVDGQAKLSMGKKRHVLVKAG